MTRRFGVYALVFSAAMSLAAASVVNAGPREPEGRCGGPHGQACRAGDYCRIEAPFGVDKTGVCVARPNACPHPIRRDAVCGRDGVTYESRCLAAKAGVNVESVGPCRRTWGH